MQRLMLLDGNGLIYRGYFALPPLTTSRGELVNAVFGFCSIVLRGIADIQPDYLAVAFDLPGPTFRHERFADYKAQRAPMPDALRAQFPMVREVVRAMRIPVYERAGFEADDVIGSLTVETEAQGIDTTIVTGDLDMLQLVTDRTRLMTTRSGVENTIIYDPAKIAERFELRPDQMIDYKALKGDPTDNIPGVPGVGEKTAARLVRDFGTLDSMYERIGDVTPEKLRQKLLDAREQVLESRELATIVRDVPVTLDLEGARIGDYDREAVIRLFREFEFRTLIERLPPLSGETAGETVDALRAVGVGDPVGAAQVAGRTPGPAPSRSRGGSLLGDGSGLQLSLDFGAAAATIVPAMGLHETSARPSSAAPVEAGGDADLPASLAAAIADPGRIELVARDDVPALADWLQRLPEIGVAYLQDDPRPLHGDPLALALAGRDGRVVAGATDAVPAFRELLAHARTPLVGHEVKPLLVVGLAADLAAEPLPISFDTQVAAYILNASLRSQAIADVVAERLDLILPPPAAGLPPSHRAGLEALGALAVRAPLAAALDEAQLARLYHEIELPLIPVLARMEATGVAIDREALAALDVEFGAEIGRLEAEIYLDVGHEFNLGSPKQLEQVLFYELDLPKGRRTKTGYSTDASVLEELKPAHPMIGKLLDWRTYTKLRSTYVEALPGLVSPRDDRLHTTFHQAVAATGRLSSSDPNLQNIPIRTDLGRRIRRAFVAGSPEVTLLAADYSQIELRILAHVSGDEHLRDAFARKADIHRETAARVLHKEPGEVTRDERSMAKMVNFGIAYGMSDFGLSTRAGISRVEAKEFIDTYFATYSGISYYMLHIKQVARDQGYVTTLLGRRRSIPELRVPALRSMGERMAINMPIQGTAADIIKIAMIRLAERLQAGSFRARLLLQVHDELVLEVPRDEVARLAPVLRETMETALQLDVPLTVEVKVGDDWESMRPLEPVDRALEEIEPAAAIGDEPGPGA